MVTLVLAVLVSFLSVLIVAWHGWAGKVHFASERMPSGAKLLAFAVATSAVLYLILLWSEPRPAAAMAVGFLIECASLLLFVRTMRASREARLKLAFDPGHPHSVVRGGPYRFVRHPFYTSYLLFWLGWAIATWSPWSVLSLALMCAIYVLAARGEERKFANSPMAADYAAYRRTTGMFWPRLLPRQ